MKEKQLLLSSATVDFLVAYLSDFIEGHTTMSGQSCSICGGFGGRHRVEDCFVGLAQGLLNDLKD